MPGHLQFFFVMTLLKLPLFGCIPLIAVDNDKLSNLRLLSPLIDQGN